MIGRNFPGTEHCDDSLEFGCRVPELPGRTNPIGEHSTDTSEPIADGVIR